VFQWQRRWTSGIQRVGLRSYSISKGIVLDSYAKCKGKKILPNDKPEVLQGTLDLMVLKTLEALGPQHGYGVARRIEQLSDELLRLNEGTVYTALIRLQQKGWIESEWGTSENNRKARFYSISVSGRKQLARETESWERMADVITRMLRMRPQER